MKSLLKFLIIGLFITSWNSFASPSFGDLDDIVKNFVDQKGYRGSVLVKYQGSTLLQKGYGTAIESHAVANDADSIFRIGSLSKQFTAAMILDLHDKGELDVDDFISDHVDVPTAWSRITIHHLLTHTSGFEANAEIVMGPSGSAYHSAKEIVDSMKSMRLRSTPGSRYHYSNAGYTLLSYLIEEITLESYGESLAEALLRPNGLRYTGVDHDSLILRKRSLAYITKDQKTRKACCFDILNFQGAGAVYSRTDELLEWFEDLSSGNILSTEATKMMFKRHVERPDSRGTYYGYGWIMQGSGDNTLVWHNGSIKGYGSVLAHWPKKDLTIIVFANHSFDPYQYVSDQLAAELAKALIGQSFQSPLL